MSSKAKPAAVADAIVTLGSQEILTFAQVIDGDYGEWILLQIVDERDGWPETGIVIVRGPTQESITEPTIAVLRDAIDTPRRYHRFRAVPTTAPGTNGARPSTKTGGRRGDVVADDPAEIRLQGHAHSNGWVILPIKVGALVNVNFVLDTSFPLTRITESTRVVLQAFGLRAAIRQGGAHPRDARGRRRAAGDRGSRQQRCVSPGP
ncbi:MAG TPA: hypothetical protein VFD32_18120 [Dehalococcoidia bacterium]|nr:hypothetical protein [Dehalococcoidia bacterium]